MPSPHTPIPHRPQVPNDGTQVNRFGVLRPRGLRPYLPRFTVAHPAPTLANKGDRLGVEPHKRNNIRWFVEMPDGTGWTGLTDYTVVLGRWAVEFGEFVVEATHSGETTSQEFLQEYRGDPLIAYVSAITGTPPGSPTPEQQFRIWYGEY
jgi:hypothetical protein